MKPRNFRHLPQKSQLLVASQTNIRINVVNVHIIEPKKKKKKKKKLDKKRRGKTDDVMALEIALSHSALRFFLDRGPT
jgi:phage terminase large subunit-like protein